MPCWSWNSKVKTGLLVCKIKLISLLERFYTICLLINILEILLISLCDSIWPVSAALSGRVSWEQGWLALKTYFVSSFDPTTPPFFSHNFRVSESTFQITDINFRHKKCIHSIIVVGGNNWSKATWSIEKINSFIFCPHCFSATLISDLF